MKLADPILISQIISSLGLTGQEAETKRQELEKLSNDELNKLIANISSFSPTSLGGFSALEKQNKFNGNVFQNNFVDNASTSFSTTQNNQPKEYTRNQQKELDKFLGDFLYNSTSSGLQTITNYNDSIGILNITDRAVNGFKVLTGQQDRIGLQEQMTKEVEEAKKLQKAAYSQPGAFESKIERKFGIPYSHSNVEQLKTASEEFTRVSAYHDKVELLEQGFEEVKNILRQEQEYEQAKKYVRGAAAASLTPPEVPSHQKFGDVLLQFCNGDKNVVNEYMKNLSSSMGSRAEIEKNLPQIMNELLTKCKEQEQEALGGKTFSQYEQEYNTACKKVFGTKDYKQTAQNFVNNAKTQAAYTEVGLTIATAILLPGSSTVKTGIQKAALKYGEKTAVQGFKAAMTFGTGSMPATLSTLNAATSKEGFTPEKIEEIKEKFKNGLVYGSFGAYASGPLGNAVEKVLSKNPTMLSNIVSKTMGTATETSADVLFDRITSDLSFTESLKQNGVMNFGMMIAGGRIAKGSDNSLSSLKVAKNNDGSYSVKDNTGKEVFKATDGNEIVGFVLGIKIHSYKISSRAELKEKLRNGKLVKPENPNITVPKAIFEAPRVGFDETTEAYVNMIRNNKVELQELCNEYLNKQITEKELASKFENFLADKMYMPLYPEIKQQENEKADGEFDATDMTITYNTEDMGRLSKFFGTLMHEMHHFLQQKEIFCNMSIEEYASRKAFDFVAKDRITNPHKYNTREKINNEINKLTQKTTKKYKEAGWEEVIQNYPANTNTASLGYKRAELLFDADINYDSSDLKKYYSNLQEVEAHEINVRTELEFEYSVLGAITKEEYKTANQVYTLINENYKDYEPLINIKAQFDSDSFSLIEITKEAISMGIKKPEEIVLALID